MRANLGRRLTLAGIAPLVAVSITASGAVPAATPTAAPAPAAPMPTPEATPSAVDVPVAPGPVTTGVRQVISPKTRTAVLRDATVDDIPEPALAAYQRAAQVINTAQTECRIPWTLLAGVGRVESDHGRAAESGKPTVIATSAGPQRVADTDGGKVDGNARSDRAVGPMHLLPATWAVVAVDADGDGQRDPQDVDDAALGAAVLLCGGGEDLSTRKGSRAALLRYNSSASFVRLVLSLSEAYTTSYATATPVYASRAYVTGPTTYPVTSAAVATRKPTGSTPGKPPTKPAPPTKPVPPTRPTKPTPPPAPPAPTPPPADAVTYCTAAGFVDDPSTPTDAFDACIEAWTPDKGTAPTPPPPPEPTPTPGTPTETTAPAE